MKKLLVLKYLFFIFLLLFGCGSHDANTTPTPQNLCVTCFVTYKSFTSDFFGFSQLWQTTDGSIQDCSETTPIPDGIICDSQQFDCDNPSSYYISYSDYWCQ